MAAGEDEVDSSVGEERDALMEWYGNLKSPMDQVHHGDDLEVYHVRAVLLCDGQLVVLDSGADISLLPQEMADRGQSTKRLAKTVLEDAQGGRLRTYGRRSAQIEMEGENDELIVIEDDFVVSSVRCPLISLGRLLHKGWTMRPNAMAPAGVNLVAPDQGCEIPLQFKRNSLAVFAHIRMVNAADDHGQPGQALDPISCPLTSIGEDEESDSEDGMGYKPYKLVIQTVVQPYKELTDRIFRRGWTTTEQGNPFIITLNSTKFLNPTLLFPWSEWPRRSTLIQLADYSWEVVEHCASYFTKLNYEEEITECYGRPTLVLTMLHKTEEPLSIFGTICGQEEVEAEGAQIDAADYAFQQEPMVPPELQEGLKPEELSQLHPGGVLASDEDGGVEWIFDNKPSLVVNGNVITASSSLAMLRASAEYLGTSRGGAKQALWDRLNQAVQRHEHQMMFQTANRLYREEQLHKGLVPQSAPREPSREERLLHEMTHLPYRSWCDHCVACKARADPQRLLDTAPEERRSIPTIEVDYAFGKIETDKPTITVLLAIDTQSKMLASYPVESKGADLRGQAEHLVKFSLSLNYMDKTEFVGDSEPTMKSLLNSVQLMRQQLGFSTVVTHAKPGEKGRTAQIERAIQTVRRQASTLTYMAESKCELRLPADHALHLWSYNHAVWLINRFHCHSTTKVNAFELANGRRYSGKVAVFGEVVMLLHRRGLNVKQGPQWVPGIWLGKTENEDLQVVATCDGVLRGKAIRRTSEPWRPGWLFMVNEKPFQVPKRRSSRTLKAGAPITPKPVMDQHPEHRGRELDDVVDYDAKDVMEYAQRHPHDSDEEDVEIQDGRKREAEGEQSSSKKAVRFDETAADPGHEKSETSSSQALPCQGWPRYSDYRWSL